MDLVVNHSSDEVRTIDISKTENEHRNAASMNGSFNHGQARAIQSVIGTFGAPRGTLKTVNVMNQTIGDQYSKVRVIYEFKLAIEAYV